MINLMALQYNKNYWQHSSGHEMVTFFSDQYSDGYHFVNSISTKTTALTSQCVMSINWGGIVVVHAVFKFSLDLIFTF